MATFDWVTVEYKLPDPEAQGLYFQTQDFDCTYAEYKIDVDGRFLGREHDYGELNFYALSKSHEWYEYNAFFMGGYLLSIERINLPKKK